MAIRRLSISLFYTLLPLIFFGCAHKELASHATIQLEAQRQAEQTTKSAKQIIAQTQTKLDQARVDNMEFYAPLHMENAQKSLTQAQEYLENPPEKLHNASLMQAIAANKLIENAYQNKQQVESHLKDTFANKRMLDALGTNTSFDSAYTEIQDDLKELIILIEQGKVPEAVSGQQNVIKSINTLEIEVLLAKHLAPAERFLEQAEAINAEEYAPQSFIEALQSIETNREYITKNYRNLKGVEQAGKEAMKNVQKAYFIAKDAKPIINMTPLESEAHVLQIHALLTQINHQAQGQELPPQPYKNVAQKVTVLVAMMKNQNTSLIQQLETTRTELEGLKLQDNQPATTDIALKECAGDPEVFSESLEATTGELTEMEDDISELQ